MHSSNICACFFFCVTSVCVCVHLCLCFTSCLCKYIYYTRMSRSSHTALPPVWPSAASHPLMPGGGVSSRCGGGGAKSSVSPRRFSPWAPRAGREEPHSRHMCVSSCLSLLILPSIVAWFSIFSNSTSSFYSFISPATSFLLLFHPSSSSLSSWIHNCSWFPTSSVGCSYHIKICCTELKAVKPLGFSLVVNLLHFQCLLMSFSQQIFFLCRSKKSTGVINNIHSDQGPWYWACWLTVVTHRDTKM